MESRKAFYIVKELLETGTELYETAGSVDFWLKSSKEILSSFIEIMNLVIKKKQTKKMKENLETQFMSEVKQEIYVIEENKTEFDMQIKKLRRKVEIGELNLQQKRKVEKELLETAKGEIDSVVKFYRSEKEKLYWGEESEENKKMNAKLDEWFRDACRIQNMLRQQLLDWEV